MNPKALSSKQSDNQNQWTPKWFIEEYQRRNGFTFDIDVAACKDSRICKTYLSPKKSAFVHDWIVPRKHPTIAFLNPPWRDAKRWVIRCLAQLREHESLHVHVLLPSKTETLWFAMLTRYADTIEFIIPRLNYYDPREGHIRHNIAFGSVMFCLSHWSACRMPLACCFVAHGVYHRPPGAVR